MITFAKLADARQLPYKFPGAQRKFKFYSQRVSTEQYTSIFMSKKSTIFLPAGINVFKMTQNKVNDCIKVSIPILDSLASCEGNKRKINFNNFQTKGLYHTGIEKNKQNPDTNIHSCTFTCFQ